MRLWETPVPMPNMMVKTQTADDTWLETAWESKWLPGYKKGDTAKAGGYIDRRGFEKR